MFSKTGPHEVERAYWRAAVRSSFGISPWDTDGVKAALEERGLEAEVDTSTNDRHSRRRLQELSHDDSFQTETRMQRELQSRSCPWVLRVRTPRAFTLVFAFMVVSSFPSKFLSLDIAPNTSPSSSRFVKACNMRIRKRSCAPSFIL